MLYDGPAAEGEDVLMEAVFTEITLAEGVIC